MPDTKLWSTIKGSRWLSAAENTSDALQRRRSSRAWLSQTEEAKGKGVYPQGSLGNLPHVIPAGDEIKTWVKLQIVGARHAVPLLKANKPTPSEWIREKEYESVPKGEISKDCTIMVMIHGGELLKKFPPVSPPSKRFKQASPPSAERLGKK